MFWGWLPGMGPAIWQGQLTCDLGIICHSDSTNIVVGCGRNFSCTSGPMTAEKNKDVRYSFKRLWRRFLKFYQLEAVRLFSMAQLVWGQHMPSPPPYPTPIFHLCVLRSPFFHVSPSSCLLNLGLFLPKETSQNISTLKCDLYFKI